MSEGHVKEVRRDGEYYHVRGVVDGRPVDVHVPAHAADVLDRKKGLDLFKRSVERVAEAT